MYASCVCPKCGNIFDLCGYVRQEDFKGTPLESEVLNLTPPQYESWYSRMFKTGKLGWFMLPDGDEALAYGGRFVGMCKICQKKRDQMQLKGGKQ